MHLGQVIAIERKRKGMNQYQFADAVGLTQTSVSQIEVGNSHPSKNNLDKISEVLDVPVAILHWKALGVEDVPEHKKDAFVKLKPAIDNFIDFLLDELE